MMTLYIDIILLENIVMNSIILITTGMICKTDIKYFKIILSSSIGAIYAILIYVLNVEIYTNSITKMLISVSMVYIAFNPVNIKIILKQIVIFYLTSFCFGGASYYLLHNISPNLIKSVNGVLTGTYPLKIAILGGILGFFIINIAFKIIKNKLSKKDMIYSVDIFFEQKRENIKVILDTGNLLNDPITNIPVLIVEVEKLKNVIPYKILDNIEKGVWSRYFENIDKELKTRCSIIPFKSIGNNNGIIIGFRPDYIKIYTEEGEVIRKKVIIGIYNNKITRSGIYSGLIGLNLLNDDVKEFITM